MEDKKGKLIVLQGLQASGKSTFAKKYIELFPEARIVNRDAIRFMLVGKGWEPSIENAVTKAEHSLYRTLLNEGRVVISDATNLNPRSLKQLSKIAEDCKAEIEIKSFMDVPLEDLLERDSLREKKVGKEVILDYHKRYVLNKEKNEKQQPQPIWSNDLPNAAVCDLDGTIALMNGKRGPYDREKVHLDDVSLPVRIILDRLNDISVIYVSGRSDATKVLTQQWIKQHSLPDGPLLMRKDGDMRKDAIVKTEIYNEHIKDKYNVLFALDDRAQVVTAWNDLGIYVFRCGKQGHDNF